MYISSVVVLRMELGCGRQVFIVGPHTKPIGQQLTNAKFDGRVVQHQFFRSSDHARSVQDKNVLIDMDTKVVEQ